MLVRLICCLLLTCQFPYLGHSQTKHVSNRGLYIYNAGQFLQKKNSPKATEFLTFCKNNGITYLLLMGLTGEPPALFNTYRGIGSVNTAKAEWLADFVSEARKNGVIEVGIGCSSYDMAASDSETAQEKYEQIEKLWEGVNQYNRLVNKNSQIDVVNTELEWWNLNTTENSVYDAIAQQHGDEVADHYLQSIISTKFNFWLAPMQRIAHLRDSLAQPAPKLEVYLGYLSKDNLDDFFQAELIAACANRILLHVYTNNIELQLRDNYKSRWQQFGAQNKQLVEIWPLFSAQAVELGSGSDFQGYIMLNDSVYKSLSAIENQLFDDLDSLREAGYFKSGQNFTTNGSMWFNYNYLKAFVQKRK